MKSVDLKNLINNLNTIKVRGEIAGSTSAAVVYYVKPSVKCRLVGAKLVLFTNTEANGKTVMLSKTLLSASDLPANTLVPSTGITANDPDSADTDLWKFTMPNAAITDTAFTAEATRTKALLVCDPLEDDDEVGNAVKVSIQQLTGGKAMTGLLELEFEIL